MTVYFNPLTKEYPRHDGDLMLLGWVPGTNLPTPWVEVELTEPPSVDTDSAYEEVEPENLNGTWKMAWKIRSLTEDELALKNTPYPQDGLRYLWNSTDKVWKEING